MWNWEQRLLDHSSFVTPIGTRETPLSPLVPFRKQRHPDGCSEFLTSNDVGYCSMLGYTYPELAKTNFSTAQLRQWVINNFEWTTIAGDPPPLETVFEKEDLEDLEIFPPELLIDGRGPPIQLPAEEHGTWNSVKRYSSAAPRVLGSCFGGGKPSGVHKRYKHLKGLIKDGGLVNWNATILVRKYGRPLYPRFPNLVFTFALQIRTKRAIPNTHVPRRIPTRSLSLAPRLAPRRHRRHLRNSQVQHWQL